MRVLIVEKNINLATVWTQHLCREGFSAEFVNSSDVALAKLSVEQFQVIVVNRDLPDAGSSIVSDYSGYRWPGTQVIMIAEHTFFSGGSIFELNPNARAFVPANATPDDLVAMVSYFAQH